MKNIPNLENIIIAHRGNHNSKIPENSLLAFKTSLKENRPIELDVQLTKDNVLVVFHDYNLLRMTNQNLFLQDLTYSELKEINLLNTNEKIPTLKEVLSLINGKVLLDIEIKNTKRITDTCKELLNELQNYPNNYLVKSFNPLIVFWFKKNAPNIPRGLLIMDNYTNNKLINIIVKSKATIKLCTPDFLAISKKMLKQKKWQKYQEKLPILIWTIKSRQEITYKNKNIGYICNIPFETQDT